MSKTLLANRGYKHIQMKICRECITISGSGDSQIVIKPLLWIGPTMRNDDVTSSVNS